ncbi:MerR family transcriptional regulator [Deinococcus sp. JMULE3]|nr:MerR family transcriptional regulator [Deinococcus sp. JMULE3]
MSGLTITLTVHLPPGPVNPPGPRWSGREAPHPLPGYPEAVLGIEERWSGGIDALVSEANRLLAQLLPGDRAARLKDEMNPRLVRHYTTVGLLPAPTREGREARYGRAHLLGLLALRRLMADGLSGKALVGALLGRSEEELADLALTGVTGENPSAPPERSDASLTDSPGLLLLGNMKLPTNPAVAYLDGLRRPAERLARAVPETPSRVLPSPALPSPAPSRWGMRGILPRASDHASTRPGQVWRRVEVAPGLEVQVSADFRAPHSEARWADLLRRVRDVLEDSGT